TWSKGAIKAARKKRLRKSCAGAKRWRPAVSTTIWRNGISLSKNATNSDSIRLKRQHSIGSKSMIEFFTRSKRRELPFAPKNCRTVATLLWRVAKERTTEPWLRNVDRCSRLALSMRLRPIDSRRQSALVTTIRDLRLD